MIYIIADIYHFLKLCNMDQKPSLNSCTNCVYKSWAFQNLESNELEFINDHKKEQLFKKGEVISIQGDKIKHFLYLQKGLVKLFKTESNTKEHIISIAKPQDFIGLLSIFSNKNHVYSISAIEDSLICKVELSVIKNLIKENGAFALDFFEKMSSAADSVIKTRIDINTRQLRGRIAYILLFFSKHIYSSKTFSLPVSRKEIAELIDMSTENVIRVLSEFRKDKLIDIEGKSIMIMDIKRLEKIYELG